MQMQSAMPDAYSYAHPGQQQQQQQQWGGPPPGAQPVGWGAPAGVMPPMQGMPPQGMPPQYMPPPGQVKS